MLQIMGDNYKDSMLVALKVCQVLNDYSSLQLFFIVAVCKKIARLKLHSCQCHIELKTYKCLHKQATPRFKLHPKQFYHFVAVAFYIQDFYSI